MKLFVVLGLLVASSCALPRGYVDDVVFDEAKFKKSLQRIEGDDPILPLHTRREVAQQLISPLLDQATANKVADTLFTFADTYLLSHNYDPYTLPDLEASFSYHLIITYHGSADLRDGDLKDISTMRRVGDVHYTEDLLANVYHLEFDILFGDLHVDYDYDAEIMGLGPSGGVQGTARNVLVTVSLAFDSETRQIALNDFEITSEKHVEVTFSGNSLVDWLLDLLADAVTTLLKQTLWDALDRVLDDTLNKIVDEVNEVLPGIIGEIIPEKADVEQLRVPKPVQQ